MTETAAPSAKAGRAPSYREARTERPERTSSCGDRDRNRDDRGFSRDRDRERPAFGRDRNRDERGGRSFGDR
ncbi:hypothetical protein, partial [Saccharothrix sp. ST-888]|uniref:hypothetical protein n=1 Tax=Saccharothrix sp. ST-888 TaxID=1427391 RepID=UPI0012E0B2A0